MISKELEKIGIHGAYRAFKMMRARAFRADIWRYMTLWHNGGVYIDAKYGFTSDLTSWIDWEAD